MANTAVAANLEGNVAILGTLDKLTGRVSSIEVEVGDKAKFIALEIEVMSCYYKPPEQAPDNMIYLKIKEIDENEKDEDKREKDFFNGWMYSSSPAISALEHPVYDIWSIECKNVIKDDEEGEDEKENSDEIKTPKDNKE